MWLMIIKKLIVRSFGESSTLLTLKNSVLYLFNALVIAMLCISYAHATTPTQYLDDFNGVAVDKTIWTYPTGDPSFYGQTQIRPNYPSVSNGLLHLQLDTYNPTGDSFYGSEIISRGAVKPDPVNGTGIIMEVRARMVTPVKGLVGGLFLYNYFTDTEHSEIDFELLSNIPNKVHTNIYANVPLGIGNPELDGIQQLDITKFNNYRIEWFPDRVRWFINNQLVRDNTTTVPKDDLAVHLNFWVPRCDFAIACDASLIPASRPEGNKSYLLDVDWVRVLVNTSPQIECLFNWAESNYPNLFRPANSPTLVWSNYTYRYYADTNTYLGVSSTDSDVYYMGPDGLLWNEGPSSYWLTKAGCLDGGPPPPPPTGPPSIEFTSVPTYGSFDYLSGRVVNVDPNSYRIAAYIYVGSGWWTKPTWGTPLIPINANGTFSVNITTGGIDEYATEICAFLVPQSFIPPLMYGNSTLPSTLNSFPKLCVTRTTSN